MPSSACFADHPDLHSFLHDALPIFRRSTRTLAWNPGGQGFKEHQASLDQPGRGLFQALGLGVPVRGRWRRWRMGWNRDIHWFRSRLFHDHLFDCLQDALASQRGKADLRGWRIEDSGEKRFLDAQDIPDSLLNAAYGQQVDHLDRARLPQAMHTADPLLQACRIPGRFEIDDCGGCLKIESYAPGIGRKEHFAMRVVLELLHE